MEPSISEINNQIKNCKYCRLYNTRIQAVCGEGSIPSKFMFIAQAPGRMEDQQGEILIGPSGKVFNKLLKQVQLDREKVYVTNLVKCFLPKCRKPKSDEINTCNELYLKKEIEWVKPEIIVALGYHVSKFIFKQFGLKVPSRIGFRTSFGKLFVAKNKKIIPVRHPATVVHQSKQFSKLLKDYDILITLQSECKLKNSCTQFKSFEKGLIPFDFIEQFCHGDWKSCTYFN